jgi:hypothetical protein
MAADLKNKLLNKNEKTNALKEASKSKVLETSILKAKECT